MKTPLNITLSVVLLAAPLLAVAQTSPPAHRAPAGNSGSQDNTHAMVLLSSYPLSTSVRTKPAHGQKIDFNSNTVKSYRALLASERNQFKNWLKNNAPAAKVTGEFDLALNAVSVELNGTSLATLQRCSLVKDAQYEMTYSPTVDDPDLGLIHAIQAWQIGGGATHAGEGVKVAMIDTGIDIHHPCFDDTGYPKHTQYGDKRFTNNKVIAARVFNEKAVSQNYTPEAIQAHGTHTSGTVGCNNGTAAIVNGVTIPYGVSGVAPRALLGNYNVFPGLVGSARSEDITAALEAAYEDGFDVANMSLGGRNHSGRLGNQDILVVAVNHLDQANMVVAIAAGNAGPGLDTIESPGTAERGLTAGASTVPHFIGTPVTINSNSYGAAVGAFATVTNNLTAPLGVVSNSSGGLGLACAALPAGSLTGKIALLSRGSCTFSTKIRNAQAAGAVAVLVVNNVVGDPVGMAQDGTPNQPTIPAYMLSKADGSGLIGDDGAATTISASLGYFQTANADFMAGFSSEGPVPVSYRVKPDVVAPGVNVLSSIPVAFCNGSPCWAFFQGTSMATPHLAGSAAVLRWLYPNWSAAEIRSAIVNTADQNVLKKFNSTALEHNVNIIGAGRENLLSAANAVVTLDPVSVSFGGVPSGSGQNKASTVTLRNVGSGPETLSVAVGPSDPTGTVSYFVTPASISLSAGQTGHVTVIMKAAKDAVIGGHQAWLTLSAGTNQVAHAAVYTLIK